MSSLGRQLKRAKLDVTAAEFIRTSVILGAASGLVAWLATEAPAAGLAGFFVGGVAYYSYLVDQRDQVRANRSARTRWPPPGPGESHGQMARRLVGQGLVGQGNAPAGDFPDWSSGLRRSLAGAGPEITPAERALGANIGWDWTCPNAPTPYAELVYGMHMASHPAGVTALTLRNEGYGPADGWSQGIDAATPFGTQHVEAVIDSLRAERQVGGSPDAVQAEFGKRLDDCLPNSISIPTLCPFPKAASSSFVKCPDAARSPSWGRHSQSVCGISSTTSKLSWIPAGNPGQSM